MLTYDSLSIKLIDNCGLVRDSIDIVVTSSVLCPCGSTVVYVFRSPELFCSHLVCCCAGVRYQLTFRILDIFSKSCWPILTKLGMHDPWDKAFHICTTWGAWPPRGLTRGQKCVKLGQTSKIFFSKTKMPTA